MTECSCTPVKPMNEKYAKKPWKVGTWLEPCFHFNLREIQEKYPPSLAHAIIASIRHHILKDVKHGNYKYKRST